MDWVADWQLLVHRRMVFSQMTNATPSGFSLQEATSFTPSEVKTPYANHSMFARNGIATERQPHFMGNKQLMNTLLPSMSELTHSSILAGPSRHVIATWLHLIEIALSHRKESGFPLIMGFISFPFNKSSFSHSFIFAVLVCHD